MPTRVISPFSSTRSSLICVASGMSPTSSRNIVPPWAYSNLPMRSVEASVNAPFTWPNSSLSRMFSLKAAQFSATNGLFLRGLFWWMAWATSSLPVPVSPWISTLALVGAMRLSRSITSRICGLSPITPSKPNFSSSRRFSSRLVRFSRELSTALLDARPKLGDVQRLDQIVEGPVPHGLDGRGHRAVAGHEDHLGVGLVGLRPGENAQAVDVVHHQIGDHHVEGRFLDQPRPFAAGGGHAAATADPLETFRHGLGVRLVVVDDQHFGGRIEGLDGSIWFRLGSWR